MDNRAVTVRAAPPALVVILAAALAGCGSSSGSRSSTTASAGSTTSAARSKTTALEELQWLKASGLPIGGYVNYTASTDDNHLLGRPGQYIHKVNFHDKRLEAVSDYGIDGGGSIETFKSESDAKNRFDYVHAMSSGSAMFSEYEYLDGTVLLRLSHHLTPAQALAYRHAIHMPAAE